MRVPFSGNFFPLFFPRSDVRILSVHPQFSHRDRVAFLYDLDVHGLVLVRDLVPSELAVIDEALDVLEIGAQHPPEVIVDIHNLYHKTPSLSKVNPVKIRIHAHHIYNLRRNQKEDANSCLKNGSKMK